MLWPVHCGQARSGSHGREATSEQQRPTLGVSAAVKSSLEIRAFQDTDLNFITQLARQEDFAPGVGDIAIYANTGNQGVWLAWQNDEK